MDNNELSTNLAEVGTDLATKRHVNGFPIDADLLMLKVEEEYGFRARDRLYEIIRYMPKYEQPLIYSKLERLTEPHWISVTERLPEINEDILLSYFDEVTIGWLNSDGSWSIFDGQECVSADEISAWMPLPRAMEFKE